MATQNEFDLDTALEVEEPDLYKVILLNDDYTSMDFVVDILMRVFHKTYEEAEKVMLAIHKEGRGLCGVYTHEIAETKVYQVKNKAKESGFPLRAIMERDE